MSASVVRPGTPFPHAYATHSHSQSYFPTHYAHSAQPLHFSLHAQTAPTPPSLLKRASSSGSNSSRPRSPIMVAVSPSASTSTSTHSHIRAPSPRRISTSSSSTFPSPAFPITPLPEDIEVEAEDALEVEVEDRSYSSPSTFSLPEPMFKAPAYPTSRATTGFPVGAFAPLATIPSRPKLKRRDTPRPVDELKGFSPLGSMKTVEEIPARRTFTSAVDGGNWLIVA